MPAHFDAAGPALVVDHLTLHDPGVVAEARRWSTGHRGAAMPTAEMTGCDLTAYVSQAVIVGAHAIATAGGAQEAYRLDALVADVGERTAQLSREAERATGAAIQQATATIEASTAAVRTDDRRDRRTDQAHVHRERRRPRAQRCAATSPGCWAARTPSCWPASSP